MSQKKPPETVRRLFQVEEKEPGKPADQPEIIDRTGEAERVLKRIAALIDDHRQASLSLGVKLGPPELRIVINALRDHAKGGSGALKLGDRDEIQSHCLNRLFEELVEEPSNILYTTKTSSDSIRYDAMESSFWIECLDLLEKTITR